MFASRSSVKRHKRQQKQNIQAHKCAYKKNKVTWFYLDWCLLHSGIENYKINERKKVHKEDTLFNQDALNRNTLIMFCTPLRCKAMNCEMHGTMDSDRIIRQ